MIEFDKFQTQEPGLKEISSTKLKKLAQFNLFVRATK